MAARSRQATRGTRLTASSHHLTSHLAPHSANDKRYDMDLRDSRELALQRLSRFCRAGFVSVTDFRHDPLRIFAAHECAALVDPSMATKMTVGGVAGSCSLCACACVAAGCGDVPSRTVWRSVAALPPRCVNVAAAAGAIQPVR
jgi:hypothetical protein